MKIVEFHYGFNIDDEDIEDGKLAEHAKEATYEALIEGISDRSDGWYPRYTITDVPEPPKGDC